MPAYRTGTVWPPTDTTTLFAFSRPVAKSERYTASVAGPRSMGSGCTTFPAPTWYTASSTVAWPDLTRATCAAANPVLLSWKIPGETAATWREAVVTVPADVMLRLAAPLAAPGGIRKFTCDGEA